MARISGVDLPREKRVEIGLTYIYGIVKDFVKSTATVEEDIKQVFLLEDKRLRQMLGQEKVLRNLLVKVSKGGL